jgi:ribosomal protein L21E
MRRVFASLALSAAVGSIILAQGQPDLKQALAAKVAELKDAVARDKAAMRQYQWVEKTDISLKGEVKKQLQKNCYYGVDGKLVKVDLGGGNAGGGGKRGIRGRIAKNKAEDLAEYMDRVSALVQHYMPPESDRIQAAFEQGNVAITPGPKTVLTLKNYYLSGDSVDIALDPATKKLSTYSIKSYLADPEDTVTMVATFASLPDGTGYVGETVLNAKAKEVQVKVTNFGHRK